MNKIFKREEIKLASFAQRFVAYLIDWLFCALIMFVIVSQTQSAKELSDLLTNVQTQEQLENLKNSEEFRSLVFLVFTKILCIFYALRFSYLVIFFAISTQTLGCKIAKCHHVNMVDFNNASWGKAIIKTVVLLIIDSFLWGALLLLAFLSPLRQTLADKSINQVVICA